MKTTRGILTFGAIAALTLSTLGYASEANIGIGPAVFVMTNDATASLTRNAFSAPTARTRAQWRSARTVSFC